jgi:competence protein ComFC
MVSEMPRPSRLAREAASYAQAAVALLVPPLCVGCEHRLAAGETRLCESCRRALRRGAAPGMRVLPLEDGGCLKVSYGLEYTPLVSRIIGEMKYSDKPGLADLLVEFLLLGAGRAVGESAAIVPVPVHPAKKRERGYNQSEVLGRRLAEATGADLFTGLLVKRRNTPSQATRERQERLRNVAGSFGVRGASRLGSRKVVLVDDVITTGSTLRECAEALLGEGVEGIEACVVASSV